mmetsp:Transcript_2493/g.7746  ORF Transcript_2493/g.7746 Transcript_2493/m.7746 type:complete len:302 (+) Transcript_2493:2318-3223(+)
MSVVRCAFDSITTILGGSSIVPVQLARMFWRASWSFSRPSSSFSISHLLMPFATSFSSSSNSSGSLSSNDASLKSSSSHIAIWRNVWSSDTRAKSSTCFESMIRTMARTRWCPCRVLRRIRMAAERNAVSSFVPSASCSNLSQNSCHAPKSFKLSASLSSSSIEMGTMNSATRRDGSDIVPSPYGSWSLLAPSSGFSYRPASTKRSRSAPSSFTLWIGTYGNASSRGPWKPMPPRCSPWWKKSSPLRSRVGNAERHSIGFRSSFLLREPKMDPKKDGSSSSGLSSSCACPGISSSGGRSYG